jgi:hypothetical protein
MKTSVMGLFLYRDSDKKFLVESFVVFIPLWHMQNLFNSSWSVLGTHQQNMMYTRLSLCGLSGLWLICTPFLYVLATL